ncbi:MAG: SDR family NAD(P)-dependent oxidoreductase [Alphaproteobacteria bacterium]|nr:SDR family NAD(P)-dependent oxidoreductase [Alphaproteobacteria bacterium]
MDVSGKAALVTGGASGLGAATVKALISRGAKVTILDFDRSTAERYGAEVGAQAIHCNVAEAESVESAVADAIKRNGVPRVLVNCAGIGTPGKAVSKDGPLPLDVFSRVIGVNLIGTFNVIRVVAATMQKLNPLPDQERGVIINTASIAAYDGQIGQVAYAASKGGVVSMTLPLAREFASFGIRVMTIAPGVFLTPMLKTLPEKAQQSLAANVPFPSRLGDPAEYAALALHIIENQMLNGEVIRLDAALRMAPR